jgi:predicted acetyltransferase
MEPDLRIVPIKIEEKYILADLLQVYFTELSAFKVLAKDEQGRFSYKYLDLYWQEPERLPFFIKIGKKVGGFVLVNNHSYIKANAKTIAEFFILPEYRRQRLGKEAALTVFDMFPGWWEVAEEQNNFTAQAFWKKIIQEYSQGNFIETVLNNEKWQGPIQQFQSGERLKIK